MNLLPALALATLISDDACSARLDHLLVLYREYGLPLPPPDAPLISGTKPCGGIPDLTRHLDFGRWTRDCELSHDCGLSDSCFGMYDLEAVKPDPVALGSAVEYGKLDFAIKCHERGWRSLARTAFRKWLARADSRAERQLACDAWWFWSGQLRRGAPLPTIAKHCKQVFPHTGFADENEVAFLRSLELALVPARSAPGSDDALIDELIESWSSWEDGPAYQALARRGFDVIPALIAHLGDDRLIRYSVDREHLGGLYFLRVKDVAYRLICEFAGEQLEESKDIAARTFAVGRWFTGAQKMGEEEYLASHFGRNEYPGPGSALFPLLVEKYPARLPEVFRRFMDTGWVGSHSHLICAEYASAIVEAPIALADKLKVLEYAATHTAPEHWWVGVHAVCRLDRKRGIELLIAALDRIDPDASRWATGPLARLVVEEPEPKVWAALERAMKRANPRTRSHLLRGLVTDSRDKPTPDGQRRRIVFLASYLNDTGVYSTDDVEFEVRNDAATLLDRQLDRCYEFVRTPSTVAEWAQLRESVRLAIEHELRCESGHR